METVTGTVSCDGQQEHMTATHGAQGSRHLHQKEKCYKLRESCGVSPHELGGSAHEKSALMAVWVGGVCVER